jgi:hypothetical protein
MPVTRTIVNTGTPFFTPDGELYANKTVTFQLVKADTLRPISLLDAVSGEFVVSKLIETTTTAAGLLPAGFDLWPNTRGTAATYYQVSLAEAATKPFSIRVTAGEGNMLLLDAIAGVLPTPPAQTLTAFEALLATIEALTTSLAGVVTTTVNGLMSFVDKVRLDTLWDQVSALWSDVTVVRTSSGLAAAVSAAAGDKRTIKITVDQTLTANLTIPSNIELVPVNLAKIDRGAYTVAYAGSTARWPLVQVFSGTGVVTGLQESRPEWFGAVVNSGIDASAALNQVFAGPAPVHLQPGTYIGDNLTIPSTGTSKVTSGGMGKTIIQSDNPDVDILTIADGARNLSLSNFTVKHVTKGIGDGVVLLGDNPGTILTQVYAINCRRGFHSKYLAWLQRFVQCRADDCDAGFYANGLNSVGGSAGTTMIYDQCYTTRCTNGFHTRFLDEVQFNMPIMDFVTSDGILSASCRLVSIKNLHSEGSTMDADASLVRITGVQSRYANIDGFNVSATTAASGTSYAIRVESPSAGFNLQVSGVDQFNNTSLAYYSIVEDAAKPGIYIFNPMVAPTAFPATSLLTLTGGGRLYDYSTILPSIALGMPAAHGTASVDSADNQLDTGLGRLAVDPIVQVFTTTDTIPTVGAAVTDMFINGIIKVKFYKLSDGTLDTGTYSVRWLAY